MFPVHSQNALYSSRVNVFSTEEQIEHAILTSPTGVGTAKFVCTSKRREGLPVCRAKAVLRSFLIVFKALDIGPFPARTGLSQQEKKERKERDLYRPPIRFLSRMHWRFLNNQ